MAEIVALDPRPKRISAETVSILRDYLAKAEAGDIEGVAIVAIEPNGSCLTQASATDHFQRMIGAVAILQHRMLSEQRRSE